MVSLKQYNIISPASIEPININHLCTNCILIIAADDVSTPNYSHFFGIFNCQNEQFVNCYVKTMSNKCIDYCIVHDDFLFMICQTYDRDSYITSYTSLDIFKLQSGHDYLPTESALQTSIFLDLIK